MLTSRRYRSLNIGHLDCCRIVNSFCFSIAYRADAKMAQPMHK